MCNLDYTGLNDTIWEALAADPMEEDLSGVNVSVGEVGCREIDAVSATAETVDECMRDSGIAPNSAVSEKPGLNGVLDMNDPSVLGIFASLLLFANNPSDHYLSFDDCDSSKQTTIQALAAKLNLQYAYDASCRVVRLRKEIEGESFGEHPQQPVGTQMQDIYYDSQIASMPTQQRSRNFSRDMFSDPHGSKELISMSHTDPDWLSRGIPNMRSTVSRIPEDLEAWGEAWAGHGDATPQEGILVEIDTQVMKDERDLGQIATRSVTPSALRDSWVGLSRTLKEVGACWRCRILRKKCDPEQPCKACPRPLNWSRWRNIGCKRGTLLDHVPRISLCPKADVSPESYFNENEDETQILSDILVDDKLGSCLQNASDRLATILAPENDTYTKVVIEILCSSMIPLTDTHISFSRSVEGNLVHIIWGLIDITLSKRILRIESMEHTVDVIKAAVTYETEYGQSYIVPLAIECFRDCIDILRIYDAGLMTSELHDDCKSAKCQVQPFQSLSFNIRSFIEELSKVILRKENRPHDRRWWLSVFYGLWIQSYVRRVIRFVGQPENQPGILSPEMQRNCSEYLLLGLELFDAASASFDPLLLAWSLENEPHDPKLDLRLMKYYRLAQKILLTEQWTMRSITNSIDYLSRLFQDMDTIPMTSVSQDINVAPRSASRQLSGGATIDTLYGVPSMSHTRPSVLRLSTLARPEEGSSNSSRIRYGAKRRARSPPGNMSSIRRNGSSSSMLDRDIRTRSFPIPIARSPMSNYSFAYGTSNSTKWNGSTDSLADMGQLFGSSPPTSRSQFEYSSSSNMNKPALHTKSSNESFLELPLARNRRRPIGHSAKTSGFQGQFVCECCPKKPKRFETAEELSAHEAERQYECSFCANRFKTKNEAERHQNSLHLRRQAWSCAALVNSHYENAFQESINQPGAADTCGYCGADFPRTGGDGICRHTNENDRRERLRHLRIIHKYGECNLAKKFYRADHFRQHLKHSHGATSGKWMNLVENVCMTEEENSELRR
ncbi:hypothetical protein F4779DRAFT_631719 [Xylariaceae sp. FL0662B]|nr:hypothetical protein F4779DRAFT_631719 [Xylariaceae sp. FL0662B]